jgi:Mn2+/Fe2+ NRAMP family transporter
MPFMILFQASATGNKENEIQEDLGAESKEQIPRKKYLSFMRRETLFGAIVTELLMIITEMAFSNIPNAASTSSFTSAQELGSVLTPVAGIYSPYFFSIGLISAGFIALIVISMASAWGIGETLNISRRNIWLIYVVESLPGVVAALFIPPGYLISLVIYLLVFFVFVLIGPMAMIGLVGSNRKIMSNLAMSLREKVTYWITFTMVISTALLAVIYVF